MTSNYLNLGVERTSVNLVEDIAHELFVNGSLVHGPVAPSYSVPHHHLPNPRHACRTTVVRPNDVTVGHTGAVQPTSTLLTREVYL